MNRSIMLGRLVRDPEERRTQGTGELVLQFDIAVPRRYRKEGDPEADFFKCCAFGKTAEAMAKSGAKKGNKFLFEGEMRNNNYTDSKGAKRYEMQYVVSSVYFCEPKAAAAQNGQPSDFAPRGAGGGQPGRGQTRQQGQASQGGYGADPYAGTGYQQQGSYRQEQIPPDWQNWQPQYDYPDNVPF